MADPRRELMRRIEQVIALNDYQSPATVPLDLLLECRAQFAASIVIAPTMYAGEEIAGAGLEPATPTL